MKCSIGRMTRMMPRAATAWVTTGAKRTPPTTSSRKLCVMALLSLQNERPVRPLGDNGTGNNQGRARGGRGGIVTPGGRAQTLRRGANELRIASHQRCPSLGDQTCRRTMGQVVQSDTAEADRCGFIEV